MTQLQHKIAIIGGVGLGDNLIQMVLAHNAYLDDKEVTVFSNVMCQLRRWFPFLTIRPSLGTDNFNHRLMEFGQIFAPVPAPSWASREISQRWIYYEQIFDSSVNRVESIALASQHFLKTDRSSLENGIQVPEALRWRYHQDRVVLNPTSADENKNWQPHKFVSLAHRLKKQNLEPVFIMSESEREQWVSVIGDQFPLYGFPTIDECASFTYESGFFIGNDSGGGHLAANLNIPVLSVHGRRGKAQTWQPGWGTVVVVIPPVNLIGGNLRQRYWKLFLSVDRVEKYFWKLVKIIPTSSIK